jgi:hypothetical protein
MAFPPFISYVILSSGLTLLLRLLAPIFFIYSLSFGLFGFSSIGITSFVSAACRFLSTVSLRISFFMAENEFSYEMFIPAYFSAFEVSMQTGCLERSTDFS